MNPMTYSQALKLKISRYTSIKECNRCGSFDRYISPTGYDECERCRGSSSCGQIKYSQSRHNACVKRKLSRLWS